MGARSLRERAEAAAAAGDKERYVVLTTRAAREGDPEAQFDVATWRLWGLHAERDLEAAHKLLVSAGATRPGGRSACPDTPARRSRKG